MSWPSNEPSSAPRGMSSLLGVGRTSTTGADDRPRTRARLPMRLVLGALSALLVIGSALHLGPAIKAGLHDGTRGSWVATTSQCRLRTGCLWHGKFVLPNGHVLLANASYSGPFPAHIHTGTSLAGIYPGGGLVFPASGSDLWISLVVGLVLGLLGLYWASHRWVAGYIRERRTPALLRRLPPS